MRTRRSKPIVWFGHRSITAKWSSQSYSRTWLPPDSARIRKVSRSNETKLIQSHYRELTALRAVNCTLGFIVFRLREKRWREGKGEKERGKRGGKVENSPVTVVPHYIRDGQRGSKRFMSHFAFICLPERQTSARKLRRAFLHASSHHSSVRFSRGNTLKFDWCHLSIWKRGQNYSTNCRTHFVLRLIISELSHEPSLSTRLIIPSSNSDREFPSSIFLLDIDRCQYLL